MELNMKEVESRLSLSEIPGLSAVLVLDEEPYLQDSSDFRKSLKNQPASLEVGGSIIARGIIKKHFGQLDFVVQEVFR